MYTLQTFIGLDREIDNDPNVVAPIGELSTRSRTYARDVQSYRKDELADVIAHVFSSKQDNASVTLRGDVLDAVYTLSEYVYNRALSGLNTNDATALTSNLEADLGGSFTGWSVGDMVSNGSLWMPSYIIAYVLGQEEDTSVRLFFADAAFQNLYDQYHITVSHPVDQIDDLQGTLASITAATVELNTSMVFDRLGQAAHPYPYTLSASFTFAVVNPQDPTDTLELPWSVAIYGQAGNNVDAIYSAIRASILENSSYGIEDWEDRIPDLFKTVEFTLVPFWDQYSVPNQSLEAGLFSPLMRYKDIFETLRSHMPLYSGAHIQEHADVTTYLYKSIAFGLCGGPENRNGLFDIRSFFPDYATLSTTSIDFNRMSPETRGFVHRLSELLLQAELAGEFTLLPAGYSKVWRENRLYIITTYQNIQFYTLAKASYVPASGVPQ
jgi:hypothetical protein